MNGNWYSDRWEGTTSNDFDALIERFPGKKGWSVFWLFKTVQGNVFRFNVKSVEKAKLDQLIATMARHMSKAFGYRQSPEQKEDPIFHLKKLIPKGEDDAN